MRRLYVRMTAVAAATILLLAACQSGGTQPVSSGSAAPQTGDGTLTPISLRLSWIAEGYDAATFLAQAKGYFKDEGLDVTIGEGNGSGTTTKLIGNKSDDIGYGDAATVAKAIATGVPVKVVAVMFQKSPLGTIYNVDSGIKEPKDLEGARIGDTPGSGTSQIFPAFLGLAGVDKSKIEIVNIDPSSLNQTLLTGRIDGFNSYPMENVPILNAKGGKVDSIEWADYGLSMLGTGVTVNNDTIKERPEVVRGFLKALARGWEYSIEHPDEAVDALLKAYPKAAGGDRDTALEQFRRASEKLHTDHTKDKPIFWMAEEDWTSTQEILAKYAGLKGTRPIDEYYTNEFVPGS